MKERELLPYKKSWFWFLIVHLLVIPFVYSSGQLDPALQLRFTLWAAVDFGFLLLLIFKKDKTKIDLNPGLILLLLFQAISLVGIFVAVNRGEAWVQWFKDFQLLLFIFLAYTYLKDIDNIPLKFSRFLLILGLLNALIGFYQLWNVVGADGFGHTQSYLVKGLSAHRNLFSQLLLFCLPFSVYVLVFDRKFWKVAAFISALLSLALIVLLLTKSVWVALLIAFVLSIYTLFNNFNHFGLTKGVFTRLALGIFVFLIFIGSVFLIYAKIDSWETIEKQTYWIRNYKFGSSLERVDLWEKSLDMYRDNVFTGVGSGNWRIQLPAYGTDGLRSEEGQIFFNRPHNDFVGVLAENGVFGFVCWSFFFLVLFYLIFRLVRSKSLNRDNRYFVLTLQFALFSFVVVSLLSFPKERVELSLVFALISALILHFANEDKKLPAIRLNPQLLLFIFLLVSLANTVIGLKRSISETHLKKALLARDEGNWKKVIDECSKANSFLYSIDNTSIPVKWYEGSACFNLGDTEGAFRNFSDALKVHPNNLHVLNNLGTCYEIKNEHDSAVYYYQRALRISSKFTDALLNLTAVYYNQNDFDQAFNYFNRIKPDEENQSYLKTRGVLLHSVCRHVLSEIKDKGLFETISRINNDDNWLILSNKHALENKRKFRQQLIYEAVYVMQQMDGSITAKQAQELLKKYAGKEI